MLCVKGAKGDGTFFVKGDVYSIVEEVICCHLSHILVPLKTGSQGGGLGLEGLDFKSARRAPKAEWKNSEV